MDETLKAQRLPQTRAVDRWGLLSYISRRFLISYLCSLHTESLAQFGVVSYQDTYLDVSCVYPDVSQIYLKCSAITYIPVHVLLNWFCFVTARRGRAGRGSVGCRVLGSRSSARGMPSPCKVRQRRSCHSVCCCRAAAGCSAALILDLLGRALRPDLVARLEVREAPPCTRKIYIRSESAERDRRSEPYTDYGSVRRTARPRSGAEPTRARGATRPRRADR